MTPLGSDYWMSADEYRGAKSANKEYTDEGGDKVEVGI